MKKYAVDILRSDSVTIVVEAEDRETALNKACEIAWNIPSDEWCSCEDYQVDIYDELDELVKLGYSVAYRHEIGFLTP